MKGKHEILKGNKSCNEWPTIRSSALGLLEYTGFNNIGT
jgi:hypothetical protein